jgi:two-component system nitrate/nitrite response regulator NarL
MVRRLLPDIVLLDLNMKDMSGLDVLKALKAWEIDTRIVMLTVSDQAEDLISARKTRTRPA